MTVRSRVVDPEQTSNSHYEDSISGSWWAG